MKIPIALVRRLNIWLIIYLDDILLMGSSLQEIMLSRDILIFILQKSGVCNKLSKISFESFSSDSTSARRNRFPHYDSITLLQKKGHIILQCQDLLNQSDVSLRQMTQLIGRLSSTAIVALPETLQYWSLQRQKTLGLSEKQSRVM